MSLLLQQPRMECAQRTKVKLIQRPDSPPADGVIHTGASITAMSHSSNAADSVGDEVGCAQGQAAFTCAVRAMEGSGGVASCHHA